MAEASEQPQLGVPGVEYDYSVDPAKLGASVQINPMTSEEESLMNSFYKDVTEATRSGEIERILTCFKLNPYEFLNLRFDATVEEVKKQYRKVSLLVHPDKCSHERARDAFAALGQAHDWIVDDDRRKDLMASINHARELLRGERKKEVKADAALAAQYRYMEANGLASDYETTAAFHDRWKAKAREVLANIEWRRRKMTLRIKDEEKRVDEEEKKEREERKKKRKEREEWDKEEAREERVHSWRDFMTKEKKKKGGKTVGVMKPPKLKQEDETHTYIARSVHARSKEEQEKDKKKNKTRVFS